MPFEIPFVAKVILGIFLFQLALLWMALPLAIYGIKKRMQLAKEQRDEFLQELFWLRKTVETIPGASGVARRHSQKFMQDITGKEKTAAGDEDGDEEEAGGGKKKATKAKAAEDAAAESKAAGKLAKKKKTDAKTTAKKPAEVNRDVEPRISVPKPAASLLEGGDYEEEEDPEDDYPDVAFEDVPRAKKKAQKKEVVETPHDDGEDYEDDSLDYMEEGTDSSHLLIDLPLQSSAKAKAQAMTKMVVEIPEEDEISENEDGMFVYRGKPYDNLLDAMKRQQDDARKAKAS